MKKHNISLLCLQETKIAENKQESSRPDDTWYFSGENKTCTTSVFEAGVAIVLANPVKKYLKEIEPISDRLMSITLQAPMPIAYICAYAIPATRPGMCKAEQEVLNAQKDTFYEQLAHSFQKHTTAGPTHVMGDFNARLEKCASNREAAFIGPRTFDINRSVNPHKKAPSTQYNRRSLLDFCRDA